MIVYVNDSVAGEIRQFEVDDHEPLALKQLKGRALCEYLDLKTSEIISGHKILNKLDPVPYLYLASLPAEDPVRVTNGVASAMRYAQLPDGTLALWGDMSLRWHWYSMVVNTRDPEQALILAQLLQKHNGNEKLVKAEIEVANGGPLEGACFTTFKETGDESGSN